ncbi:MAG: phosphatidylserine decarboxylase proenzyme [Candidatus Hydrogenedentota bacterium]
MNAPFSGWREGLPFYGPPIGIGAILLLFVGGTPLGLAVSLLVLGLGVYVLYFFRDPHRHISEKSEDIVSPADGKVVAIEDLESTPYYEGPCRRVSIFLSIFNVHVNRAPFHGTVESISYRPGKFLNAMKTESSDVNEANTVVMSTPHGQVTVRQISGLIARRIVCRAAVGDSLTKGERFGMIRFGSRTELYLPPGTPVCVKLRESVRGGATVMARFADAVDKPEN